jgi:asparaginyl-tRNA synthetase
MPDVCAISDLAPHIGQEVCIRGWLYGKRSGGKIHFLLMRDGTGLCQCVVEAGAAGAFAAAEELTQESSFSATGVVRRDERAPGGCEIAASSITVLQIARDYPITRKAHGIDFLMSRRHLWVRSRRQTAILRIRHTVSRACREFFDGRGFTLIDTPILTTGAGEDTQSLFPVDYFGEKAFLTQTGQLHLESACMALGKVYCFGPTFRAEKSKTRRHLTEFWMLEPEVAFAELDDILALAEALIGAILDSVLSRHADDLAFLGRDIEPLKKIRAPFARITYTEAAELLRSDATRTRLEEEMARDRRHLEESMARLERAQQELATVKNAWKREQLQSQIQELTESIHEFEQDLAARPEHMRLAQSFSWGKDLGGSDETVLSRQFDRPLFVTHYPRAAKAFYMKVSPSDGRVVNNFDLLAPEGYGEIIGGSQREEDLDVLQERMAEKGLEPSDYDWYMDLRRYGTVPHGGFGLGIERTLAWLCGLTHVREAIPFARTMGRIQP